MKPTFFTAFTILALSNIGTRASVLYVDLNSVSPAPPYTNWATAATNIQDAVDAASPGDLVLVTNGVYQTGSRSNVEGLNRVAVTKALAVQSVNGPAVTAIAGYQVPTTIFGTNAVRCVYLTDGASLVGFTLTNGATPLNLNGGGVYCHSASATLSNCVLAYNSASWDGGGAFSGVVQNCTLTGNTATSDGGGASLSVLNNCIISSNSTAGSGGGTVNSTLSNCIVRFNYAKNSGGGAAAGVLLNCLILSNSVGLFGEGGGMMNGAATNCLIMGNSAYYGAGAESLLVNCTIVNNSAGSFAGGTRSAFLHNCIVYSNTASVSPNWYGGTLDYCCTTPSPATGAGNITNTPLFVNAAGGDFRLQSNSPCINAGKNSAIRTAIDLDGHSRIVGGTVDIGAYEFQTPASVISYAWLQQYGLPTDGSADFADTDGDGMNNWQEWRCGTDPTNPLSVLKMLNPSNGISGPVISWESVGGIVYYLQSSRSTAPPLTFSIIQSNIVGQTGVTSFTDTVAAATGPLFYRVGVH
jgi:hypothetical protein